MKSLDELKNYLYSQGWILRGGYDNIEDGWRFSIQKIEGKWSASYFCRTPFVTFTRNEAILECLMMIQNRDPEVLHNAIRIDF